MNELKQFLKYLVEIRLFPQGRDLNKIVQKYSEYKELMKLDNFIMHNVKIIDAFGGVTKREMTERQIAALRIENAITKVFKRIDVMK